MKWFPHYDLVGKHAFLGASKWHWLNYTEEKLLESWKRSLAVERGTRLHALAAELINLGQKLPDEQLTLNLYVNDAINYKMRAEQVLYYSDNCFGTADAICFRNKKLRIHDLKTGDTPTHMEQLLIYAALFCLEYKVTPGDITFELRIYQGNDALVCNPTAEDILPIMDRIKAFDRIIQKAKLEGGMDDVGWRS